MPNAGNLLDYGIAINFFGNYRQEGGVINRVNNSITQSFLSLQNLLIGGGISYAVGNFMGKIISTGKQMEMQFAQIKGVLGDVGRTMETLNWAKMKGMTTSLSDTEVTDAVVSMVRMGLAKDKEQRDKNFDALADFTAMYLKPKGFSFEDAVDMVSKASFGNWERLGDNFGIRKTTIGTQWQSAQKAKGVTKEETSLTKYTETDIKRGNELLKIIQTGKQGSDAYKQSLVELLGLMSKGGMAETLNTFTGVMSNLMEIPEGFFKSFVGYAQQSGTLWNAVVTQMQNFFGVLTQKSADGQTALGNFFRFATDLGSIFVGDINSMGDAVTNWARKIRNFFQDYQNNIAPIILFLYLIKLQVKDFLSGFYEGFKSTFEWFISAGVFVWETLAKITEWLGITDGSAKSLGKVLGSVIGVMVGIRAFKFMTKPLQPLLNMAGQVLVGLDKLIFKQRIFNGLQRMAGGNSSSGWTLITGGIGRATTAMSGFATSLGAVSIAGAPLWLVIGIVALLVGWIAYLIYNWDEVGKKMQGVSDTALILLSIFAPIIGIPLILAKHWDRFKVIFTNIWRILVSTFNIVTTLVKLYIQEKFIDPIKNTIKWFKELWTNLETNYPRVAGFLKVMFAPVLMVVEAIKWLIENGGNFLDGLLTKVGEWTGNIADNMEGIETGLNKAVEKRNEAKNEDKYQEVGKAGVTNKSNSTTTQYNVPGGINIFTTDPKTAGQSVQGVLTPAYLQNSMGKMGK